MRTSLGDRIDGRTRRGDVVTPLDRGWVQCHACGHDCRIPPGARGVCKVRFNRDGELRVPWGYVSGVQCDPVEKKPFFHAWPGSLAFSFGMLGCDLHCGYCQNWVTSQALRDPAAGAAAHDVDPVTLTQMACDQGARVMVSTYNEPLITAEWGRDVFQAAREAGLATAFVSNGNATPAVLDYLAPWLDAYKVDLKSFNDRTYRTLGGRLAPILDTIRALHARGLWVEVVTLLVPGLNDDPAELEGLTRFLADVSPDLPWHVTAFHRDYRMTAPGDTTPDDLRRAAAIGRQAGLRHVYAGNQPGRVGSLEHTCCAACGTTLIERVGYHVRAYRLTPEGRCPSCLAAVPGRWDRAFRPQSTATPFVPHDRTRLRVI